MNRLALASLKARRREYLTLSIGIMLAIMLVFSLLLIGAGMYAHQKNSYRKLVGEQDALLIDMAGQDPALLMPRPARQIGTVTILGTLQDSDFAVGYYDEGAAQLLRRGLVEGRLPTQPHELAVEQSMLARLRLDTKLDETLSLELQPFTEGGEAPIARRDFTLVGILTEQTSNRARADGPSTSRGSVCPQPSPPNSLPCRGAAPCSTGC